MLPPLSAWSSGFSVTPSMDSDGLNDELTSLIEELNVLGRDLVVGEIEGDHFLGSALSITNSS